MMCGTDCGCPWGTCLADDRSSAIPFAEQERRRLDWAGGPEPRPASDQPELCHSFSHALLLLKMGKRVAREGWNGKGMWLCLVPADQYPARTDVAKAHWGEDSLVPYQAYIAMKTVQNTVVPWLASQTDLLAEDWVRLD